MIDAKTLHRDYAIWRAIEDGTPQADLAEKYDLSAGRISQIKKEFSRTKQQVELFEDLVGGGNGRAPMGEIGVSGLEYTWGKVNEEFLSDLNTLSKRVAIYEEMRQNSPVANAMLFAIELSIRRLDWQIVGDEGDERVDFIDGARLDTSHSWTDFLGEIATMFPFGFAPFEIVYKRREGTDGDAPSEFDDGRIGWRKFAYRAPGSVEDWLFDDTGGLRGMIQRTYPDWRERRIPIEKMLLFRTTREKNNPEGRSILRPAYVPYYYVKNLQSIEAIGIERDLAGLPVVYMGANMDTGEKSEDYSNAVNIVKRIRMDEQAGVVIPNPKDHPDGMSFELVSSPGQKGYDVDRVIRRHETRMMVAAMAQFLMLGMDRVGSFSLSQELTDFFVQAIETFADIISETFNKFAIKRLLQLNGMPTENAPRLTHGPLGKSSLQEMGTYFSLLAQAGLIRPNDALEQFLRQQARAPKLTDDELDALEQEAEDNRQLAQQIAGQPPADEDEDEPPDPAQMMSRMKRITDQFQADGRLAWKQARRDIDAPPPVSPVVNDEDIIAALELIERSGLRVDTDALRRAELELARG